VAGAILPENLIRRKPIVEGQGVVLPEPSARGGFSERRTMLADLIAAASGAANSHALDQISRQLWRAHAEGHIDEADAQALSESIEARRAALVGKVVFGHADQPESRQRAS
jgi:hypothetical protein